MKQISMVSERGLQISVALAGSFRLRLRGLLGRDINALGGLLLRPCNQIHCIGMAYAIDAVYLSREGRVLKLEEAIPPGKCCRRVAKSRSVLELPAGTAAELGFVPGSRWLCRSEA